MAGNSSQDERLQEAAPEERIIKVREGEKVVVVGRARAYEDKCWLERSYGLALVQLSMLSDTLGLAREYGDHDQENDALRKAAGLGRKLKKYMKLVETFPETADCLLGSCSGGCDVERYPLMYKQVA